VPLPLRRRSRSTIGKRRTDWVGSSTVNGGGTAPFTQIQDWIVPPFGDSNFFPDFVAWSHATVVRTIVTFGCFQNNPATGLAVMDCCLGVIRSSQDALGQPTNIYSPGDGDGSEWLIRIPIRAFIPAFGSIEATSLNMDTTYIVSKAQRKLSDDQGLIWVFENLGTDNTAYFTGDFRCLLKKE